MVPFGVLANHVCLGGVCLYLITSPSVPQFVAGPRTQYFGATVPSFSKGPDKWQRSDTLHRQIIGLIELHGCRLELVMSALTLARQRLCVGVVAFLFLTNGSRTGRHTCEPGLDSLRLPVDRAAVFMTYYTRCVPHLRQAPALLLLTFRSFSQLSSHHVWSLLLKSRH